ncbi:esterase [Actinophytocola xanthii]|uniref:Esterase n=1 Tax=Actinophytocola xanthii TaxID=1912961 RepID=A0A1Q8CJY6_9PSEU|nr:esterase [Actinophytocola xanthii]
MAAAVVLGAGIAAGYVLTVDPPAAGVDRTAAPGGKAVATSSAPARPPSSPSPPPPPDPILPFNAKLTTQDIPTPEGGVRPGACSGALIAPDWVITAGHCFRDLGGTRIGGPPPFTMTVVVGKLKDSDPGGHIAQVVDVRQSPVNDLAVVRLSSPVADITPLALADTPPPVGQQLQFAGWGSLSATVFGPSDHLKRGRFTVASIGETTMEAVPVAPRTVENSPCPQDSGAPFFVSDDNRTGLLVAIVNSGPPCPQPGREVIARVDVVADWIAQQTGNAAR